MTCEEARKNLPLFLYGELSFDEEEQVEVHVDECPACRTALAREKALFQALDGAEMVPAPELLEESRADLRRRLGTMRGNSGMRAPGIWDKFREGFTVRFHFAPGIAQVAGAAAMLVLGFLTAVGCKNTTVAAADRERAEAEAAMRVRVSEVTRDLVLVPTGGEIAQYERFRQELAVASAS